MRIGYLSVPASNLRTIFNDYGKKCRKDTYEKIPYQHWQALRKVLNSIETDYFEFYYTDEYIAWIAFSKEKSSVDKQRKITSIFPTESSYNFVRSIKDTKKASLIRSQVDDIFSTPQKYAEWCNVVSFDQNMFKNSGTEFQLPIQFYVILDLFKCSATATKAEKVQFKYNHLIEAKNYSINDYFAIFYEVSQEENSLIINNTDKKNNNYTIFYEASQPENSITVKNTNEERKTNMSNSIFKNFYFGAINDPRIRLSIYGIAVQNGDDTWAAYDTAEERIVDVDVLSFDAKNYLYVMPVALSQVAAGDVIIHNKMPVIVTEVSPNCANLSVVDPKWGEAKVVLPTRSPFGFDFVSKVVNVFGNIFGTAAQANADAPFGNMLLPLLLSGDESKDINDLLPLLMLSGNGMGANPQNMLPFLLLSGKNEKIDPLVLMHLASGGNKI